MYDWWAPGGHVGPHPVCPPPPQTVGSWERQVVRYGQSGLEAVEERLRQIGQHNLAELAQLQVGGGEAGGWGGAGWCGCGVGVTHSTAP